MADVTLTAEKRTTTGSGPAGRLRRQGLLPAVVYGLESEAVPVTVSAHDVDRILASGANALITLQVDGEEHLTLARQVQRHPVRGGLVHVDFVRIRRDVAVAAEVPIHLEGEPEGVRDGGLLDQVLFSLTVEAKPTDIPAAITADVSALQLGDQVRVSDLTLPAGVVAQQDPDELVAHVAIPRGRAEEEAAELVEGEEVVAAAEGEEAGAAPEGGEE